MRNFQIDFFENIFYDSQINLTNVERNRLHGYVEPNMKSSTLNYLTKI